MLLDLREKVRSSKPIKYTLITLICIPFALVGVGSYLTGGSAPPVAEVNGVEISQVSLEQAYRFQRNQLARAFGGQLPPGLADETALRIQARDQLIAQQVVQSTAEEEGFAVGNETLGRAIQSNPAFQVDGVFDRTVYLRAVNGAPANFEENLRAQTALDQFSEGLVETGFTLPGEAARLDALQRQVRNVDLITLSLSAAQDGVELSDDDVQAYFDENADTFEFPERAKVEYIELNATDEADAIDILDEDALAYYESNRRNYMSPEQRSASHILLLAEGDDEIAAKSEEINDIKARIDAGESFEDLAKEFSDDPGSADQGGSLGQILPGQMVPEFETGLNALAAEGDISDPIVSQYGVHLIRLDGIQAEQGQEFDAVKDEIVETMKQDQANAEYNAILDTLEETAFDFSDELETAAAETGLELKSTDWIDVESDNGAPFNNPAVIQAVFSDEIMLDGLNSESIQIAPRHVVVLRVADSEGPRPKTIDDVRDEITAALKSERAADELDVKADELREKVIAGEDVAALAEADEIAEAVVGEAVERSSDSIDAAVRADIFSAQKPDEGSATVAVANAGNGDRVVYAIRSVDVAEAAADAPAASVANPRAGSTEFAAMVQALRSRADIELNDEALTPGAGGY